MPRQKYITPEILYDAPLTEKKKADFKFDDFAATFARLIAYKETETPLTIGINGAWGAGKTSLLLRIKNMLDDPFTNDGNHRFAEVEEKGFRKCKTVWFDAWKYNEENELLVALVRVILHAMQKDGMINRIKEWYEDPNQPSYDFAAMFINAFQVSFGGLGVDFKFQLDPKKHERPSPFEKHTAFFDYFTEAFERLLALWVHDKVGNGRIDQSKGALVIFIDDLDRCLPVKTVQILEAIKLFLDKKGCVFVLAADSEIVQAAVETHYKNEGITGENAKDYLEKIIQIRFDLPPILGDSMTRYLRSQGVNNQILQRWQSLVTVSVVNPRRIKSVINDLNLRWYIAVNSGLAEGVILDDFICLRALLLAAPPPFVQQIFDFDDIERRHSFILDAVKWQQGKSEEQEIVRGYFTAYDNSDSKRLRGVLKQISFSKKFTPVALNQMIYMTESFDREQSLMPEKLVDQSFDESLELPFDDQDPDAALAWLESLAVKQGATEGLLTIQSHVTKDQNRFHIGDLEFVRVPKGKFFMGSKDDNSLAYEEEKPQHIVDITYDYWMSKFLITNEQYNKFLNGVNHPADGWEQKKNHPVINVSWDDVLAYCKWFNNSYKTELGDLLVRLPTEAEWEKSARGVYGYEWPWGNEFNLSKCNSSEGKSGGISTVGVYSDMGGDSPYGCADMAGNVWEWCSDGFDGAEYKKRAGKIIVNPQGAFERASYRKVLKGGSYLHGFRSVRCANRLGLFSEPQANYVIGFRVCLSLYRYEAKT